jgi:hypothetical protein
MILACVSAYAAPGWFDATVGGAEYFMYDDVIISSDSVIETSFLNISSSLTMENRGIITSDIFICGGCELFLQNSGQITGEIHLGENASFTQVIRNESDLRRLGVSAGYSVLVQGDDGLYLSDIMYVAGRAEKIILENSKIVIGNSGRMGITRDIMPKIDLRGTTSVILEGDKYFDGMILFQNVSDFENVFVQLLDTDVLHAAGVYILDNNIYLKLIRETNYTKILGDARGDFLNKVRADDSNNKTLHIMDKARTMSELTDIMARSAILNPINLMYPVKVFNNFKINNFDDDLSSELSMTHVFSDGFSLDSIGASAAMNFSKIDLAISGYIGQFENSDDINDFYGRFYGANIRGKIDLKSLWIDSTLGYTISKFDDMVVFDGLDATYSPTGNSFYGVVDSGLMFGLSDDFNIRPFAGIGFDSNIILHQSEISFFGRLGASAGFSDGYDLMYDYRVFLVGQTDNVVVAGAYGSFWSVVDGAGGGLSYQMRYDDIGISHKVSAELKVKF